MAFSRRTILLVEDNLLIALDLAKALERSGWSVVGPHHSLGGAMDAVGRHRIDAALLHVTMGDTEVYPLADRLDELKIPFMFMTGLGADALPTRFQGRLVASKPFGPGQLMQSLAGLIDAARACGATILPTR